MHWNRHNESANSVVSTIRSLYGHNISKHLLNGIMDAAIPNNRARCNLTASQRANMIHDILHSCLPNGALPHWMFKQTALKFSCATSTVHRIWNRAKQSASQSPTDLYKSVSRKKRNSG